jgi:hypothetical protein
MSDLADLERSYRRWLRCYPRSFRDEHEAEILGVLMDSAQEGQDRPGLGECLDLVFGAAGVRLHPRVARSERSVFAAIRVMWVGAAVELLTVLTLLVTVQDVHANTLGQDAGFTRGQWQAVVADRIDPNVIAGLAGIGLWLLAGWSLGRGQRWPRIALPVYAAFNVLGLVDGLHHGAAATSRPDLVAGVVLCLVELVAVVLAFRVQATSPRSAADGRSSLRW